MDQLPPAPGQPSRSTGSENAGQGGEASTGSAYPPAYSSSVALLPRQPRSYPIVAWLVILGVVGSLIWESNTRPPSDQQTAMKQGVGIDKELLGKLVVYASNSMSKQMSDMMMAQVEVMKDGNVREQLCHVILTAEVEGSKAALEEMEAMEGHIDPTAPLPAEGSAEAATQPSMDEIELIGIVRALYQSRADPNAPPLIESDKQHLAEGLGWLGKFAPLTKGTPDTAERQRVLDSMRTLPIVLVGVGVWYLACGLAGMVCLLVLLILTMLGRASHGFVEASGRGGIYAETFAVWMLMWFGLSRLAHAVITDPSLAISIVGAIVPLSAIFWPVIRGVPWATMRRDVGLYSPRRAGFEPAVGLMSYCMALPMLVIGAVMVIILSAVQNHFTPGAPPPSHPVQEALVGANWVVIAQIMFLGVIVAPIGEEIMFRGVLYRHLRDATGAWGTIASMVVSALLSSFIFAAIHPQGWVFIPALMGLAMGFCLAREWRGSLLAGMIAHGTTNFISLTLNVMLFSGS